MTAKEGEYMEQKEMIRLLFDRDESVLTHIQRELGNLIKGVAYNLLRNDSVAEECLNDTLMDIWDTIPPENPVSLTSYACMIVRRRAIDRVRRETAKKRSSSEAQAYFEVCEELDLLDDVADEIVDRMELSRIISAFLRRQTQKNREVFLARYYDFESLDSIAARLHLTKNSVNIRLSRMKSELREDLLKGGVTL